MWREPERSVHLDFGVRRRPRAVSRLFFLLALFAIIALVAVAFFRQPAGGILWRGIGFVENNTGFVGAAIRDFGAQFSAKAILAEQNQELSRRVAVLEARNADRDVLYEQNIALKKQFGRPDASRSGILAAVISRPPATPYDTLVIDTGENLAVITGDFVSAGGGALIGQITDVYSTTARVTLFSSAGNTYQALLRGTTPVTVTGEGAGALTAKVPAGTEVAVGDAISFPDIAANISEIVAAIDAPENNSFKTLYLRLPANIFTLQFVEILPSYGAGH